MPRLPQPTSRDVPTLAWPTCRTPELLVTSLFRSAYLDICMALLPVFQATQSHHVLAFVPDLARLDSPTCCRALPKLIHTCVARLHVSQASSSPTHFGLLAWTCCLAHVPVFQDCSSPAQLPVFHQSPVSQSCSCPKLGTRSQVRRAPYYKIARRQPQAMC